MQLKDFLKYSDIVIQCHDNPDADALASAYGIYKYLTLHGKDPRIVYGGRFILQKSNLVLMKDYLKIPVEHIDRLEMPELLIMVDCQYKGGNSQIFEADTIAVIDHHQISSELPSLCDVRSNLGSCATIVYDLLLASGYNVAHDLDLSTALYYGLLTDTNNFAELKHPLDKDLRDEANFNKSLITLFRNSNLSLEELSIAGEALMGYEYNEEFRYAVAKAKPCDPNILGLISDMMLEVHGVDSCVIFSQLAFGVKYSVRSCVKETNAGELAEIIAEKIGNGGGHRHKAGGFLQKELMNSLDYEDFSTFIKNRLNDYFANTTILYAQKHEVDLVEFKTYTKLALPLGYVKSTDVLSAGTPILVRTLEGDLHVTAEEDIYIMIGVKGEVYPCTAEKFNRSYRDLDSHYDIRAEYIPTVKDLNTGFKIDLRPLTRSCVPTGETKILAKPLNQRIKIFTAWDPDTYMLGKPGDYMAVRKDDLHDMYVIEKNIFQMTYKECE